MRIRGHTNLVIIGRWNVLILRPDWFIKEFPEIIHSKAKDAIPVEFSFDTGFIRFTLEGVRIQPMANRLALVTIVEDENHYDRVAQLATGIVEKLPHTPFVAVGHNVAYNLTEEESMKYVPKDKLDELETIYQPVLPTATLTSHRERHAIDMSDYVLNLVFELDRQQSYIDFNFNYSVQNNFGATTKAISQFTSNVLTAKDLYKKLVEE